MGWLQSIVDLSVGLGEDTVDFSSAAGLGAELRRVVSRRADGDIANMSELRMSAHAGTHLDAPSHFVQVRAQAAAKAASVCGRIVEDAIFATCVLGAVFYPSIYLHEFASVSESTESLNEYKH